MLFSVFLIDNSYMDALCPERNVVKRFLRFSTCLLLCLLLTMDASLLQSIMDTMGIFTFPKYLNFGFVVFVCLQSLHFHAAFACAITALDILAWAFLVACKSEWTLGNVLFFNDFLPYKCIYGLFIFVLVYNIEKNQDGIERMIDHGAVDAFAGIEVHKPVFYRYVFLRQYFKYLFRIFDCAAMIA